MGGGEFVFYRLSSISLFGSCQSGSMEASRLQLLKGTLGGALTFILSQKADVVPAFESALLAVANETSDRKGGHPWRILGHPAQFRTRISGHPPLRFSLFSRIQTYQACFKGQPEANPTKKKRPHVLTAIGLDL